MPCVAVDKMIESAHLSANDQALLKTIIWTPLMGNETAKYAPARISEGLETRTLEDTLLSFKNDLEALAFKSTFMGTTQSNYYLEGC